MGPKVNPKQKEEDKKRILSGKERKIIGKDKKGNPIYEEVIEEVEPILIPSKSY